MSNRAMINEFLAHRRLALVRLSPSLPVRGARIDDELGGKGYEVSVVYLDEAVPGPRLADLKEPVEGAIVAVPRNQCEKAVREIIAARIPRVWLQRGCESKPAIELCEQAGIPVVPRRVRSYVCGACEVSPCLPSLGMEVVGLAREVEKDSAKRRYFSG